MEGKPQEEKPQEERSVRGGGLGVGGGGEWLSALAHIPGLSRAVYSPGALCTAPRLFRSWVYS